MKYSLPSFLLTALLLLGLGGCDIAGTQSISGTPVNTPDAELDPNDPANITVSFYLDRPVQGLVYRCSGATRIPYESTTDANGSLVCPRKSVASFYVGGVNGLKLGQVALSMYGFAGEDDVRNFVTVTPATLFGTIGDSSRNEAVNIFNLITSLDMGGIGGAQPVIRLGNGGISVHELVQAYTGSLNLESSPDAFILDATPIMQVVHNSAEIDLVLAGSMLSSAEAAAALDVAIRKTRAGVYTGTPLTFAGDQTSKRVLSFSYAMLVSHSGHAQGMAVGQLVDTNFSPATQLFDLFSLAPGAVVEAGGKLSGFVLQSEDGYGGAITGRLVNDKLWGIESQLSNPDSDGIPASYTYETSDDVGQFVIDDPLTTTLFEDFIGDLTMFRAAESPADVDLDLLPSDPIPDQSPGAFLPLDYALSLKGYTKGSLITDEDKVLPVNQVDQPAVLFRIRPDGDIVSDIDGDCSDVTAVGGRLFDAGGQEEYVIGQVGAVFKGIDNVTYLTFALAIYAPEHPQFGFVMGTSPLQLKHELGTAVLNTANSQIQNKSCRPGLACSAVLEWMNDAVLVREVLKVINTNDPTVDDTPTYLRPDYYGKVESGVRYCLTSPSE